MESNIVKILNENLPITLQNKMDHVFALQFIEKNKKSLKICELLYSIIENGVEMWNNTDVNDEIFKNVDIKAVMWVYDNYNLNDIESNVMKNIDILYNYILYYNLKWNEIIVLLNVIIYGSSDQKIIDKNNTEIKNHLNEIIKYRYDEIMHNITMHKFKKYFNKILHFTKNSPVYDTNDTATIDDNMKEAFYNKYIVELGYAYTNNYIINEINSTKENMDIKEQQFEKYKKFINLFENKKIKPNHDVLSRTLLWEIKNNFYINVSNETIYPIKIINAEYYLFIIYYLNNIPYSNMFSKHTTDYMIFKIDILKNIYSIVINNYEIVTYNKGKLIFHKVLPKEEDNQFYENVIKNLFKKYNSKK